LEGIDLSGLINQLKLLGGDVGDLLKSLFGNIDLTSVEGLQKALQMVVDGVELLTVVTRGIIQEFNPLFAAINGAVTKFNELDDASKLDFGNFLGAMKLIVDRGTAVGLTLIAIGRAGIDVAEVLGVAFGGIKVAINAVQLLVQGIQLSFLSLLELAAQAGLKLSETAL
jgi:hypothetical protein